MEALLGLLRAFRRRDRVARRRADAQTARDGLGPRSPQRAPTLLLEGAAYLLAG